MLSIVMLSVTSPNIAMLSVMLSIAMTNVVTLLVIRLNFVALAMESLNITLHGSSCLIVKLELSLLN
jgi:hypothetical protein